jgi:hypothetical protein
MCEPTTIALATMAVGTTQALMQHKAQNDMAKQQTAQNNINSQNAISSMNLQNAGINMRLEQEADRAVDDRLENVLEAARLRSKMVASAGDGGVAGQSTDFALRDVGRTASRNKSSINRNLDAKFAQGFHDKLGIKAQTESRLSSMPIPQKASWMATGLQIAGAGLQAGTNYQAMTAGAGGSTWQDLGNVGKGGYA